jgi:hypothetical protein
LLRPIDTENTAEARPANKTYRQQPQGLKR